MTKKKPRTRYTIAYNKRLGRWAATVKGVSRVEYPTQIKAIRATVKLARANQPSEIIIKAKDGRIRDNRTYGADPRSTKG